MKKSIIIKLLVFFIACVAMCWSCMNYVIETSEQERRETYQAWQRLHPETPIPYEDWRRLKSDYLLPGQQRRSE